MKSFLLTLFYSFFSLCVCGQLEVSTGYAVSKNLADGPSLQIAYDLKIKNRLYTKPQVGYKYLYHYNDFVGATLKLISWSFIKRSPMKSSKKRNTF